MVADPYERIARFYDPVVARTSRALAGVIVRATTMSPGDRVLDVGCGTGVQIEVYASEGARCSGVDRSAAMLDIAHRRLDDHEVHLQLADGIDLPFPDASFDIVTSTMLLHELEPSARDEIMGQMRRVVSPSGRIAIVDYAAASLSWAGRARRAVSTVVERLAGRDHFDRWRAYLDSGGLPAILPADLTVLSERHVGGGNLAVWIVGERR